MFYQHEHDISEIMCQQQQLSLTEEQRLLNTVRLEQLQLALNRAKLLRRQMNISNYREKCWLYSKDICQAFSGRSISVAKYRKHISYYNMALVQTFDDETYISGCRIPVCAVCTQIENNYIVANF